jgi:CubicO group peptidase (beta-lactamase class C family)
MNRLTAADFDRIRDAARTAIEKHHVPGLSIGIAQGDDLVFCEAFGYADIEANTPMDANRRQCIASITKTMVGLCVMALVDEGRLRLEDRIVDLFPDVRFDGPAETMNVWHLLTHTGGIGEALTQEQLTATVNPDADARRKAGDFASMHKDGVTVEFTPGTKWHYANHGYNLLGEIVQRAEKTELGDVMHRRIFGPLGMEDSDLHGQDHADLTTPYHRAPTEDAKFQLTRASVEVKDEPTVDGINIRGKFGGEFNKAALAAGGAQSTISDMAKYASALLRRGGGIVTPETFGAMIAPQYCPQPRLTHWGLSFSRVPMAGGVFVGHGGAYFGGWNSNLAILPEENLAIVQHMNVMMDSPAGVFNSIKRAVLGVPMPSFEARPTAAKVLESAPGLYELTPGRLTNFRPASRIGRITIERAGDALVLRSRWGVWKSGKQLVPLDSRDPASFTIQDEGGEPGYIVFTLGPDGRATGLRCDDLVHMVKRSDA